jgi:hypothetical protein
MIFWTKTITMMSGFNKLNNFAERKCFEYQSEKKQSEKKNDT